MNRRAPTTGTSTGTATDATPDPQTTSAGATPAKHGARTVTCPICATSFSRRANGGTCPVCGERVVAPDARAGVPVLSPLAHWLFAEGNWRTVAVLVVVLYEIALAVVLWRHLAGIHAL